MTDSPRPYPFNDFEGIDLAPAYRDAQETPGLVKVQLPLGEPAWLATRYEDVRLVLSDRRFSRSIALTREQAPRIMPRIAEGIVTMDPPALTRLRNLAVQAFTPRRVEALRPHVRALAHRLIDEMVAKGPPADLVEDYALPIPMSVICELLGVPVADQARFKEWNDSLLSTNTRSAEHVMQNMGELSRYILELVALRRREPRDDLMTALLEAHDVDDRLNERELVLLCIAILVAGYEATSSQIPNFIFTLLKHPEQLARLQANPDCVGDAVEELLRYIPLASAAMFCHYATEDVCVGGAVVRMGEPVFASVGAANRDAEKFAAPDELNVCRDAHAHMAFGHGMHHCIGAALARVELQEALAALVVRLPNLRLHEDVRWKAATFFRGPHAMLVSW
ncbi:cytochrome P450 [Pendulispora rubella]|uniref:Cytochrome P450 n=1 Tax=Pendulispora rubella TaxID=2741070 RepID=A0ABZ2L152_9BACT|nr:SrbH [Sorangiineae bacterium]